ncbi:hypothetical protein [Acidovorax sp. CCYZU-2555]|uniref:hypothetical protein n=1 Tax=Acidovorax sp. CCYZU-2555 TaxID=2835042 RepID=UPI001BCD6816|nr:hypothetical protein [Acidovorax sp. CCYZU-2555]MBS7777925.1 hypothetical protein [Acidovorax sp. CCYZU-2555]
MIAVLGSAAVTVPACCLACALAPADPLLLKQMMAKEIAFRLAIDAEQISLSDITPPKLHRPLELGADCSGRAALHHSSGFRIVVAQQQHAFATMGKPHTAAGAGARYRGRVSSGFYSGRDWAGVRRNFWRAPKAQRTPDANYSGYERWPQYPMEKDVAPANPAMQPAQRWRQYPHESQVTWQETPQPPVRWSTMGVAPAKPAVQGLCRYEGVAVVLGYDASSPVAVNFQQHCD